MSSLKKPVRVLHIITLFSVGGATETVVSLAVGLQEEGFDVTIASGEHVPSEGNMLPLAQAAGIEVIIIPQLKRNIHPLSDIQAFFRLAKLIRDKKFDIVHTHSSKAGILGRLAAWYVGVSRIVHTIHGLPFHSYQNSLLRSTYVLAERMTAKLTSVLVAVSHKIVSDALQNNVGRKEQYRVVRSGFNMDTYVLDCTIADKINLQYGYQENHFVIGKISRLSKLKGHEALIRIMPKVLSEFPNVRVLFVGDGEVRGVLEREVGLRNLDAAIKFVGGVMPGEIPAQLSVMDIVVHTSLHEGLARVIPQALVMGKPVVSYNLDGAPEVVQNYINGILIDPLNDLQLLNAIREMIGNYSFYKQNCISGRKDIEAEFSERKMVKDICDIYLHLTSAS